VRVPEEPQENHCDQAGLPLGLAASVVYTESATQLAEGEQLTLLTDGVVEARSKTGEPKSWHTLPTALYCF